MTELKAGWAWARLGDLGLWTGGGTPSKAVASYWAGDIPWVSPKDMKVDRIRDAKDHITPQAVDQSSTNLLPAGSVLVVTRSGILRHSLPVAVADTEVAVNQDLKALRPFGDIDPDYVAWILRASAEAILHDCSKAGTTVSNIDTRRLLNFSVPLAPVNEQRRIVAAIEEQFVRLDAAEAALVQALRRLDVLRISAVESALFGDWPVRTLGEVCDKPQYGWTTKANQAGSGLKLVRTTDISAGRIEWDKVPFCSRVPEDPSKYLLNDGDLVISRAGSVGLGALIVDPPAAVFASYLVRFRPSIQVDARYLACVLLSSSYQQQINASAVGIALQNVNAKKLAAIRLPVPPVDEQCRIASDIERQLSLIDRMRVALTAAQRRSEALRHSILERAFRGELVTQDPTDEHACVLLERIVAEQAANGPKRRRRKVPA
jgi:type I restriction enzyme S subunit